jgi:GGDEF domain-containing protein/CheY-like chemotaxis protein
VGTQRLNLLLVDGSFEDQQIIRDALAEIEESGPRYNWFSSEVVAVDYLADAIHCLDHGRFDAVLLDFALPDSPLVLNTFEQIRLAARGAPVIGLIKAQDESFMHRLLREGAQDVLVKTEIECGPLARSLRHAIERQRRSRALRSISFFDDLTGFYSRYGFIAMAGHDLSAAQATGAPVTMAVLEVMGLGEDLQDRDLLLLDVAETLQHVFDDAASIGRLDANSFGVVLFVPAEPHFGRRLERFGKELRNVHKGLRVIGGTVSLPPVGPCDLEQLFEEARPKLAEKKAILTD